VFPSGWMRCVPAGVALLVDNAALLVVVLVGAEVELGLTLPLVMVAIFWQLDEAA